MTEALKRTHLYQWHVEHGGRMVPFAGWEMPVQYAAGPLEEHKATRNAAGLFDIDHMGQVKVHGPDAENFLNYVLTNDVSRLNVYDARYALLCYADGGIVDDLFVYKLPVEEDESGAFYFFLVINASNRTKDVKWLTMHARGFDVSVTDVSDETYMLALQGPQAAGILQQLTRIDLDAVPRFTAANDTLFEDVPVLLGRTGYTGEDGFELFFPARHALKVWQGILQVGENRGIQAIGLAARDSLRFEPCMPLYGHEIGPNISPIEAGLGFAVSLYKEFIGRDALLKQHLESSGRVLVGFEMIDKGVPRQGNPVTHEGIRIGEVTTGMFSPTKECYLGMAYVPRDIASVGTGIEIKIHDKPKKAHIIPRPFYVPVYRR